MLSDEHGAGEGLQRPRGDHADITVRPSRRLSRRRLLTAGAGLGTLLVVPGLVGCAGRTVRATSTHQHHAPAAGAHGGPILSQHPSEGMPLAEPAVRRSVGGELSTTLHVKYAYQD